MTRTINKEKSEIKWVCDVCGKDDEVKRLSPDGWVEAQEYTHDKETPEPQQTVETKHWCNECKPKAST